jgi:hypothetical protein
VIIYAAKKKRLNLPLVNERTQNYRNWNPASLPGLTESGVYISVFANDCGTCTPDISVIPIWRIKTAAADTESLNCIPRAAVGSQLEPSILEFSRFRLQHPSCQRMLINTAYGLVSFRDSYYDRNQRSITQSCRSSGLQTDSHTIQLRKVQRRGTNIVPAK